MARLFWLAISSAFALTLGSAQAAELVLKRVLLSSGGVGYFEYEASVQGAEQLVLNVRRDQVDDVLKTIVVYDDKGGVGAISLPGEAPLVETFRELPFDQSALQEPAALLNALRGAAVKIAGSRAITGRIVSVTKETVALPDGRGTITQHRLSLMSDQGLRSVILEESDGVSFADAGLQAQVDKALSAVAQHMRRERRTLTVATRGTGARTLRVAYIVEMPVWKAAYRLTLDQADSAKTAGLQGWAVLENRSGEDWKDVELTLISGSPVTFKQALYTAYYVNRPEVPVEVLGRILPKADSGAMALLERQRASGAAQDRATAMPAPALAAANRAARAEEMLARSPETPALAQITAAESTDAATQVTFRLPQPITVANGDSLLVPIIDRQVPIERLAFYQPQTHALHPLAAVRLNNSSDSALPPGVLTLYERGADGRANYLGDARLNVFPAGEQRLVSFALDQKIRIDTQRRSSSTIGKAKLADGLLQLSMVEQQQTTYGIVAPAREARSVVLELSRPGTDWELVDPKSAELTPGAWRVRTQVGAGETKPITVTVQRTVLQRTELRTLNAQQIALYLASKGIEEPQRRALMRLAELSKVAADRERILNDTEQRRRDLTAEQDRARSNLGAVPDKSDLQRRYLALLGTQEDKLAVVTTEILGAREAFEHARTALAEFIRTLDV